MVQLLESFGGPYSVLQQCRRGHYYYYYFFYYDDDYFAMLETFPNQFYMLKITETVL